MSHTPDEHDGLFFEEAVSDPDGLSSDEFGQDETCDFDEAPADATEFPEFEADCAETVDYERPPVTNESVAANEIVELEVADEEDETSIVGRGSIAGTVVSVVVHVWLLMNLAQLTVDEDPDFYEPPIESYVIEDRPDPEEIEIVKYELANPDDRELEVREVTNAASVGLSQSLTPKSEAAPRPITELLPTPREQRVYDIPEGTQVDDRVVVKGTTGEAMVQLESALDRVTWEIAKNLQESRVLVVWLLDASGSLTKQKEIISRRLRRVYGELDALKKTDQIPKHEQPLLTGVVTFGNKTNFITTSPTDDFQTVLDGIRDAKIDASGVENVFTAVKNICTSWSRYRTQQRRRIMIVTVTDEAGDDFSSALEPSIAMCNRYGAKAYVIGPAAVFGRRKGFVPYVAPENGQTYQLPIDLGPESPVIESVDLPFWYSGQQYKYLSSGFAPYALARLVHETGGIYFLTNMTTMSGLSPIGVFDTARLKPYAPEYRFGSAKDYAREMNDFPLRMAVIRASFLSREYQAKGTPSMNLRVNPRNFRQVASNAQRTVAESQLMIDSILQAFPPDADRMLAKEDSERWRMNFCVTYGRLLAQRVRCLEYNYAFAWLKGNLANDDVATKSNHWVLKPSKKINYAGSVKKQAEKAELLLQSVVDDAPGTPWAVLAGRELRDGFGIQIDQRFIPPPPPPKPGARNQAKPKRKVLFAAQPKKNVPQKPAPKPKPPVLPKL